MTLVRQPVTVFLFCFLLFFAGKPQHRASAKNSSKLLQESQNSVSGLRDRATVTGVEKLPAPRQTKPWPLAPPTQVRSRTGGIFAAEEQEILGRPLT